jgi:SAM-dependent methyltransferase
MSMTHTMTWDDQSGHWQGLSSSTEIPRYEALARIINSPEHFGANVLDIGAGEGLLARYLSSDKKYTGIEPSAAACANAKNLTIIHSRIEDIEAPLLSEVVVFNESLYYFSDPLSVLRKAKKLFLKSNGLLIVSIYQKAFTWRNLLSGKMTNARATAILRKYLQKDRWRYAEQKVGVWLIFSANAPS